MQQEQNGTSMIIELKDEENSPKVNDCINIESKDVMHYVENFPTNSRKKYEILNVFFSVLGAFLGILILSLFDEKIAFMIVGSFGAQCVLLYSAPSSPLAQPWNAIIGNSISAFVGIFVGKLFLPKIFSYSLSVSIAIGTMHLSQSMHPPGGATALIANMSAKVERVGFTYVLFPIFFGSVINVLIAILVNWVATYFGVKKRKYPVSWIPKNFLNISKN